MAFEVEYARKRITPEGAAALVRSSDWVDYAFGLGQPDLFDEALAARRDQLYDVRIRSCMSLRPRAVVECDPEGAHFLWFNWHFSGLDRRYCDAGRCNYIPMNFGEAPAYYRRFIERVDVACVKTCPMDEHGYFNFGGNISYTKAMTERATKIVVETSATMPYVFGREESIHLSEVDHVIEGSDAPLTELANPPPTDVDRRVAELIAPEIQDGACLQIGIGGMPNAVCTLLRDSPVKDLGIHTEMLVDAMIELVACGKVTGARKQIDPYQMVFTFAAGSRAQYDYINRNSRVRGCPVDYTNLPQNIAQNDRVVSINNTAEMDLQGQAASESAGHRHVSGTGGQLQFVRGAYASRGGKSFICLASTYDRRGERRSRIVPALAEGNVVTTPRTDVMYVVTEYGMVNLKGKSVAERAKALIGIAHPEFRDELMREARERRLVPKGFA